MTEIYMKQAGQIDQEQRAAMIDNYLGLIGDDGKLTEYGEDAVSLGLELLALASHLNARSKGWYDSDRKLPEEIALVHSEASEVLEEYRDGRESNEHYYSFSSKDNPGLTAPAGDFKDDFFPRSIDAELVGKPEGIPAESADILIRVADYCGNPDRPVDIGRAVIEKLRYNSTRPIRHGGKLA